LNTRALLLDIDGTLVQSNGAHAQSWCETFAEFGYDLSRDRIRPLIGMGGDKILATLTPGLNPEQGLGKEISDRRKAIFLKQFAPGLQPQPGNRPLLQACLERCYRLIVATSAKTDELQTLLRAAGIDDLIHDAATSDDASNSKPDPDIVEAALEKARVDRSHTLMLGDTPYDILSAHSAGIKIIALRCGGWREPDIGDAEAVYDDPEDLRKALVRSNFRVLEELFQ